jgi:O-antigen ligase
MQQSPLKLIYIMNNPIELASVNPVDKVYASSFLKLSVWDVQFYDVCDWVSGWLIFSMIIFSPWAFGTTQNWSIWTMNGFGYALGILLLFKFFVRFLKNYSPPRWSDFSRAVSRQNLSASKMTRFLAILTCLILIYCLTSALNAKATFDPNAQIFKYYHCIEWLPHSFDRHRTWFIFWMYLGLACAFWALHDWLGGMTLMEQRLKRENKSKAILSTRLRQLLWLLCLNGTLVGIEAIIQRALHSNKLLFILEPRLYHQSEFLFGPYAYRANAAQFFNLLWPLCLGFWWTLQRSGRRGRAHHLLLFGAGIMAACPFISSNRGGTFVALGMMVLTVIFFVIFDFFSRRKSNWKTLTLLAVFLVSALALGWYFGWDLLAPRLSQISEGYQGREEMFDAARPMAKDYPWFGTGPGTFSSVFRLYRYSSATYSPFQLHDDWLETRITFGWIGFALILSALACVIIRWFWSGGIPMNKRLTALAQLALAGCLIHALFDFPLQIYSTLFLFLLICAILFSASKRNSSST